MATGGPGDGVDIRQMTEDDSQFAGRLLFESFKGKFSQFLGKKCADDMRTMLNHPSTLAHHRHRVFVAESQGKRAGAMLLVMPGDGPSFSINKSNTAHMPFFLRFRLFLLIKVASEKVPEGTCMLDAIMVDSDFRGRGIGKSMLAVVDREAAKNNCREVTLLVADGNIAKRLYERNGYVDVARKDSWLIQRILGAKFTVMTKTL